MTMAVATLVACGSALAADPPTPDAIAGAAAAQAQETLRQQARQRALREQQELAPNVRLEAAPAAADGPTVIPAEPESPCFSISRIELKGELSTKFQWALAKAYVPADPPPVGGGRCLGNVGINLVMKRIQNAIVERGFVTTRIVAEQQDLRSGTLSLTLVPGRIRSVRFDEGSSRRATQWNAVPLRPGQLLNLRDIEQALENFKRLPTAETDIQITPAQAADAKPGESDLVIAWKQGFPLRLNASVDDAGTRATGKYQGSVTLSSDHLLRLNDLFYVNANHDLGGGNAGKKGSNGSSVHYSMPFGYWMLGITNSRSKYSQTVAGANQAYLYQGDSLTNELKLSRLVYRDAKRKSTVSLSGWTRKSHNFIDDVEVEAQRRRMAGWEAGIAHREFAGAAIIDGRLAYRRGTGARGSESAPEQAFGEGTSRMKVVTADAQYSRPFKVADQRMSYTGAWRAQWNRTPLVPQDRFSIGGRYTVRGFDGEALLSAERGWLIRNDVGLALGNIGAETYVGLDYGQVGGASTQLLAGRRLAGAVVGVRGGYKAVTYDLFVGAPISKPDNLPAKGGVTGFSFNGSF
jgi:hemolysin activation/secretion protein